MPYVKDPSSAVTYDDRDFATVDTTVMRDIASAGASKTGQFKQLIERMNHLMKGSEAIWQCDAGDQYRAAFDTEINRFLESFEVFRYYTSDLIDYACYYDDIERKAEALAESIEVAVWNEVI